MNLSELYESGRYAEVISLLKAKANQGCLLESEQVLFYNCYVKIIDGFLANFDKDNSLRFSQELYHYFPDDPGACFYFACTLLNSAVVKEDLCKVDHGLEIIEYPILCNYKLSACYDVKAGLLLCKAIFRNERDIAVFYEVIFVLENVNWAQDATENMYGSLGLAVIKIGEIKKDPDKLLKAIDLLEEGKLLFKESAKLWDNLGYAWLILGQLRNNLGDFNNAIDNFNESLRLSREFSGSFRGIGYAYYQKAMYYLNIDDEYEAKNLFRMAEHYEKLAVELFDCPYSHFYLGVIYEKLAIWYSDFLFPALKHYLRAYYFKKDSSPNLPGFVHFLSENFDMPALINRIYVENPELRTLSFLQDRQTDELDLFDHHYKSTKRSLWLHLKKSLHGDRLRETFSFYEAIISYLGGDPIMAFHYHEKIKQSSWSANLCNLYYHTIAADAIIHEEAAGILARAVAEAKSLLDSEKGTMDDKYYAASILVFNQEIDPAIDVLRQLSQTTFWPAAFLLAECYYIKKQWPDLAALAKWIHVKGLRELINTKVASFESPISSIRLQLQKRETMGRAFIVEKFIDQMVGEIEAAGVPLARCVFFWNSSHFLQQEYTQISLQEMKEMDDENLISLRAQCIQTMGDVFTFYEIQSKVDAHRLAEKLYSLILGEHSKNGRVKWEDYFYFLQYLTLEQKISVQDYYAVSMFLNIKLSAFDFLEKRKGIQVSARILLNQVLVPAFLTLLNTKVPVGLLTFLVLKLSEKSKEEIERMNFDFFQSFYVDQGKFDDGYFREAITAHEKYSLIQDILGRDWSFVVS